MTSDIVVHVVRHGHILSYESDVPLTPEGRRAAEATGRQLVPAIQPGEVIHFIHGPARRARETAWGIYQGLQDALAQTDTADICVSSPSGRQELRNLGLRIQGRLRQPIRPFYDAVRADYEADPSPENKARLDFHRGFWDSDDPIGYWLTHPTPHAEPPERVAARAQELIGQLLAERPLPPARRRRVICATHSATMRAFLRRVLRADPGEPDFCESFTVELVDDGTAKVIFRNQTAELAVG